MKPLSFRSPHVERLTRRLRSLDGPLIQLWAWPGAGQQAVLDAVTEDARFGQPLSVDDLSDEASLRRAVEAAFESGARWLVLPAVPSLAAASPQSADTIARLLAPGQRLVFAAPRRRREGPLTTSFLLPEEFLLDGEELADLWRRVTGAEPAAVLVDRLLAATDGWYRPLRLAAEAAAEAAGSVDASALDRLPPVASFLRHEVLGLLDLAETDLLVTLSAAGNLRRELWQGVLTAEEEELRRRLVDEWGLAVEGESGPRLPTLLRAFLERERQAWPRGRSRQLATRLGRAELDAGRPVRALAHLADAGEGAEEGSADQVAAEAEAGIGESIPSLTAELLNRAWLPLFAAAEPATLERLFAPSRPLEGAVGSAAESPLAAGSPAVEFLTRLTGVLHWRREAELAQLQALERSLRELPSDLESVAAPGLALALSLALEILAGGGAKAEASPARDTPWESVPARLRPLWVLAGLTADAGEGKVGGEGDEEERAADDAAMAARLAPALQGVEAADRDGTSASLLAALFERGLLYLLRRRPALTADLSRRRDLPQAWRRWLVGLPPAALASSFLAGDTLGSGSLAGDPMAAELMSDLTATYRVQLLGKPEVRLRRPGGRPVAVRFPLRRAFQGFAYLMTSPGFEATRDELVEAVWWDEDEAAVERNFHPTLSYLRRALKAGGDAGRDAGGGDPIPDPLILRRGVYRLNPRLAWNVDVVEVSRRVAEGRRLLQEGQPEPAVALLQSAWSLYRGPLMAGWDAPWIATRRDQLAVLYQELLATVGEVCERLGRWTEAMDACRAALLEDPLQERIHLALMRIYARQGRRDLVRRQYERLSALLSEELAVEPMAETTEAYHRLMS